MASNYPGSLDALTNPVSTDPLNNPAHAEQHEDANDAIEAVQATLGTNPEGGFATVDARLTDIATQASSASVYADAAALSASSALTSELDAASSALEAQEWAIKLVDPVSGGEYSAKFHAQAAAASASAAAASFDSFDDRYLGAKSSDPSVDNDGDPLTVGALYFNSSDDEMKQYTSASAWTSVTGGVSGSFISASVIDAKGDLIVGVSDDTVTRLPVGSNDEALVADSSASAGVKWAAVAFELSPAFTGTPTAPTASVDTNTTQIATTAFVVGQAASATPIIEGTGTVGTSLRYAREDHVHPSGGGGGTGGSLPDVFMLMGA